ncbi:hypothetical protein [Sphingomonas hengshuiensis]|uniref:Sulfotransferase family protein n=1 Tax=Sphingomonas hengshuiensis TaxID=1609977 RepID=A0A7U4LFM9_9SPHN|nr:hypothetical protein [Sphingomonas hengshuiensis]AJP72605.1 hypothetical protein TS85_13740 [Sphingomonas hengshuiensis]
MSRRTVIVHYHLFKNAGTSVDGLLRRHFASAWREVEFHGIPPRRNGAALAGFIAAHPELQAVSSHTAMLPLPEIENVDILPIIFVRHPLLRLKSAYSFERLQQMDSIGPSLARVLPFIGYARALVALGNRQAINFQTERFCANEPPRKGTEIERALRTIERLPYVGLVEAFDESVARLEAYLKPHFPDFQGEPLRLNVTNPTQATVAEQLRALRDEVGARQYAFLTRHNRDDIALFERAQQDYRQ